MDLKPSGKHFIADLHIHSHFSIATSKNLVPEYLDYWARLKGINVVGTGDCIHPGWLNELKEKLEPAGNGLLRLKKEYRPDNLRAKDTGHDVFFMLTGEISNIYKKNDRVRKVHNLCIFPDFEAAEIVQKNLEKKFNIESDGRPILGLDSKSLLETVLSSSDSSFLVPAHIWTPWFSVLGSKSGFDNLEECYDDLTKYIFAVETGLSSDPAMNWTCSFLDKFKLISNSDAHSPEKLGREANLFNTDMSYEGIYKALSGDKGFDGTIEFFPQEGKYHYDGHRKCGISWDPLETLRNNGQCTVCGKPVTKGVMYRVAELADREGTEDFPNKRNFYSITSLPDLLCELMNVKNSSSKTIRNEYLRLIENLGPEFKILLFSDTDEIKEAGGEMLSEGIRRLREGKVIIKEGYDGEFGRITVFDKEELSSFTGTSLFSSSVPQLKSAEQDEYKSSIKFNIKEFQALKSDLFKDEPVSQLPFAEDIFNDEQANAINHMYGPCMVLAGPGSGKTRILTERIIKLVTENDIDPENILAVTFSNKAAAEMTERIKQNDVSGKAGKATIRTFHSFGLSVLKEHHKAFERPEYFYIVDSEEKTEIIETLTGKSIRDIKKKINEIESYKQGRSNETDINLFNEYNKELKIRGAFDLDDMISLPCGLFKTNDNLLKQYRDQYPWILIDEYQDINAKQYELISLLAGNADPNLFVIGDPDQAIYGFRGSDVHYIEKLRDQYPAMQIINLTKTYRCPAPVMKAAAQLMRRKEYLEGSVSDIKIHIQEADTDKSEADWIAGQIEKMIGGVRSFSIESGMSDGEADKDTAAFSDFAVLCRTSLMFGPIIKAFMDHGISYQVIGTDPFYAQKPFSTIISRLRRTYYHLINVESTALQLLMDDVRNMIKDKEDIHNILNHMMQNAEIGDEDRKRMEELAIPFGNDYERFFMNLSTRIGIDDFNDNTESVSLMTLHASKGLEFRTVFIPGCEQGIIPFELFGKKDANEQAEEERLFYVGITRTKKNLYLTHAGKRILKGRVLNQKKSSFLNRLDKELLKFASREKFHKNTEDNQLDLFGR